MSYQKISLEIPVFSADDAVAAARFGADRLELCASYSEGGVTPGAGLLNVIKQLVNIPVFVMLRPTGGHFNYSELDLTVMAEELKVLKAAGADGFVFGVLKADTSVNTEACETLIDLAGDLPCTFHRAFDEVKDPFKALQELKELGFRRILTSGQQPGVEEGMALLKELLHRAENDIIIMPGGGMKPGLIKPLHENGGLKEVHASCRKRDVGEDASNQKRSMIDSSIIAQFKKEIAEINAYEPGGGGG
jgi:copper homeostasis protein